MIFPNKTIKTWTESKKKRSSRASVFFFMGNAKTKACKREMKGGEFELTPNQTSSSYMCCLRRKRTLKHI